jgi:hypothetical protein
LDVILNTEPAPQPPSLASVEKIVLTIFLSIIILMTVFGNLLVMVALCKDRHLR